MVWNPLEDLAMQQKPNPNFTTKRHACFWYPSWYPNRVNEFQFLAGDQEFYDISSI